MTEFHDHEHHSEGSVVLTSYPDERGHYHVVIEADSDTTIPMDADTAYRWAREVLAAVAAAEYDAAVMRQMRTVGLSDVEAAGIVTEIRADRAEEVPCGLVPGLTMTPGVSSQTKNGFLLLSVRGKPVGQWEMDDAREHALALLTAIEVAVLDGAYLRAMGKFGIERELSMQVVHDLGRFRLKSEGGEQ